MKNILIYFSFLLISTIACTHKNSFDAYQSNKKEMVIIEIDNIPYKREVILDSLFRTSRIIILETSGDNLIGSYDKLMISDNIIYILDKKVTQAIYAFNFDGSFRFKIARLGEGPGEYREIRDFTVASGSDHLELMDFPGGQILKFDKLSGELEADVRLNKNTYYAAFEKIGNQYITAHANNCGLLEDCFNLSFHDHDFEMLSTHFPIHTDLLKNNYRGEFHFSRNENQILYKEVLNDTIYKIDPIDQQVSAAFAIDFGKYKIPDTFKYSRKNSGLESLIKYGQLNQATWGIHDFYQSSNVLFIRFPLPNLRTLYFDLKSAKGISFDRYKTNNLFYLGDPISAHQDAFISQIPAETIVGILKNNFYTKDSIAVREYYKEFFDKTKHIKNDSNSILVFYEVKI